MTAPDPGSQFVLVDGVLVEATGHADRIGLVTAGPGSEVADEDELVGGFHRKVTGLTEGLTGTIRTFCESVQTSISGLECAEVAVEFGVAVKAGIDIPYLVTGAGQTTVKVTAKWTKSKS